MRNLWWTQQHGNDTMLDAGFWRSWTFGQQRDRFKSWSVTVAGDITLWPHSRDRQLNCIYVPERRFSNNVTFLWVGITLRWWCPCHTGVHHVKRPQAAARPWRSSVVMLPRGCLNAAVLQQLRPRRLHSFSQILYSINFRYNHWPRSLVFCKSRLCSRNLDAFLSCVPKSRNILTRKSVHVSETKTEDVCIDIMCDRKQTWVSSYMDIFSNSCKLATDTHVPRQTAIIVINTINEGFRERDLYSAIAILNSDYEVYKKLSWCWQTRATRLQVSQINSNHIYWILAAMRLN